MRKEPLLTPANPGEPITAERLHQLLDEGAKSDFIVLEYGHQQKRPDYIDPPGDWKLAVLIIGTMFAGAFLLLTFGRWL